MTAYWGVADAAAVRGMPDEIWRGLHDAFVVLDRRIGLFTRSRSRPFNSLT
jgi:hypothetical protein